MRSEQEIAERIKQLEDLILSAKTKRTARDEFVNWLHCLNWVMTTNDDVVKKRFDYIESEKRNGKTIEKENEYT